MPIFLQCSKFPKFRFRLQRDIVRILNAEPGDNACPAEIKLLDATDTDARFERELVSREISLHRIFVDGKFRKHISRITQRLHLGDRAYDDFDFDLSSKLDSLENNYLSYRTRMLKKNVPNKFLRH